MLMIRKCWSIMVLILAGVCAGRAALVLDGTSYIENFDNLGSGLPPGWSVNTGATVSDTGSIVTLVTGATSWATTTGNFRNVASADGLNSTDTPATQSASTDRALGIRQTGSFGDPGAAFELNIQNTTGLNNFSLSISLQMLSVQTRSTTWTIDYRVGDSGDFTSLGTYADPGVFGSTTFTADSTALSSWNNQSQDIWFRVVALDGTTGSGSSDTFGIDDFTLSYSAVPEPGVGGVIAGAWLLALCGLHAWRRCAVGKIPISEIGKSNSVGRIADHRIGQQLQGSVS